MFKEIVRKFEEEPIGGWRSFVNLKTWMERESVVELFDPGSAGWAAYLNFYRRCTERYIRADFYQIIDCKESMQKWKEKYDKDGEVDIPFLNEACLPELSLYASRKEPAGNHRYGTHRPSYPPGEHMNFKIGDIRKDLLTEVNMTAIATRHMQENDALQWIYHSPHLRIFLAHVMGCKKLYPYLSDLGLAVNIMRPRVAQTALGFHFDSIDSSQSKVSKNAQPKGVTGVIGIQDCLEGGERIVFPTVHRNRVDLVRKILKKYNPLNPGRHIETSKPSVFREPTKGMLYLFNGGDVLHGVSSVRKGSRIAAAFMFQETRPNDTNESEASANFFYGGNSSPLQLHRSKI
jgi:hypothetical protein